MAKKPRYYKQGKKKSNIENETAMNEKTLIIRADAGKKTGVGHVMRCMALAQEWKRQGGNVLFLSHGINYALDRRLRKEGFQTHNIENPHPDPLDIEITLSASKRAQAEWIVADGYHFTGDFHYQIKENGFKLLIIDDYDHLDHYNADVLLNQNMDAHHLPYICPAETIKLLGSSFVLLRREFLKEKKVQKIPKIAENILVTMGGSDPTNTTVKIIESLNRINNKRLYVKIVAGHANPNRDVLKKLIKNAIFQGELIHATNDMPKLMGWADLAISAGGSTSWELSFFGVPSIYITIADNQANIVNTLSKHDIAVSAGRFDQLDVLKLAGTIEDLMYDLNKRKRFSSNALNLIPGTGASQVVRIINEFDAN